MMKKLSSKRDSTKDVIQKQEAPSAGGGGRAAVPQESKIAPPKAGEPIEPLPSFKDTPAGERQKLFIRKLHLCSTPMYFNSEKDASSGDAHARDKEIKRLNLLEIMDYINTTKGVFNEATFEEITRMIAHNLFRGLPPNNSNTANYDPDEDEPVLEASWPHLQYVYEFLLRFVVSNETDPKVVKKYITQDFLVKLLDLFDSEDPRERDYLKTILHRIYGKFMPYRAFIRKAINNIFYRFIYDTERHNGIAELLEILGSIINGFALPLKDEHKAFLTNALLPLHKVHHVSMYHQQLSYCVTQFVEKDPSLAKAVLESILQFWPRKFSAKEVLFLNEVEEILEMVNTDHFAPFAKTLFKRIAICVGSPHFQVAERALFLWNNEYIVGLIAQNRQEILPIVFESLYTNSRTHWNSTVHGLTCNVVKLFMEMDSNLFDECSTEYRKRTEQREEQGKQEEAIWEKMREKAKADFPREYTEWETQGEHGNSETGSKSEAIEDVTFQLGQAQPFSVQGHSDSPTTDALKRKSRIPSKPH